MTRKRHHEELPLPSTSRCENTIGLILNDDILSNESSNTNTDDEFLPARTTMKRIYFDTKSKTDESAQEK